VAYTLGVFNAGPSDLAADPTKPVTIVDTLPAGETFVDADGVGWTCDAVDQIVTCTYSSLLAANYDPSLLVIHATVDPSTPAGTTLTNQAALTTSPQADPNAANNVASDPTLVTSEADLMLYKVHEGPVVPGGSVTYTLGVFDIGPSDLRATALDPLVVVDTLPVGLTFQSYSGDGWTCAAIAQVVTCRYDQFLGAGYDPALVNIVVGVSPGLRSGTIVTNSAKITAAPTTDPNPANDIATDPAVI
jgi:large repetitive protein